ncbi:hypothetical protein [Clavibacter tessellarius]|uniref:Uncharacterized protein n=1 Tax=Clavibacter tessellarius TaxID=31965 RepID=A0A154UZP9_9MICO|nr:hypothetical protein [Clavibacter michiganensis]KZC94608.1 hypothetical protein AWH51_12540 [Clavibacter michiganensis subsp. tessellarius]
MADVAPDPHGATAAVVAFILALTTPPWPDDAAEAERMLARLGVHPTGEVDAHGGGSEPRALAGGPDTVDHVSLGTHEGAVTSTHFSLARHGGPRDPLVRREHDALVAALTAALGPSRSPIEGQPNPVVWDVGELEVGVQLFDRVDSSVMAWVEHRERSARAEAAAGDGPVLDAPAVAPAVRPGAADPA